jgi:hypothetical protein
MTMSLTASPDLVVAGKPYLRVYRSVGGCEPGVTLVLEPPGGPPHGIGARVEVTVEDHVNVLWMLPVSASSSSAPELYLGLRGEPAADSVVVTWSDGSVSEERGVRRGTVLVLP